ncbi:hypothetical protein RclHR1_00680007 [Rhizophagus clarus]|uniref:Uncharacterized protein n=1 Tax=Rhizophagus clarus TaxID=94130 RepID=A0A2Z6RZS5_9GLOM|nr:hypothetical protein RclHR1_00680007 [Rhizophagus clarus]
MSQRNYKKNKGKNTSSSSSLSESSIADYRSKYLDRATHLFQSTWTNLTNSACLSEHYQGCTPAEVFEHNVIALISRNAKVALSQDDLSLEFSRAQIQNPNLIPIPENTSRLNPNAESFTVQETPIISQNDNAIIVDKPDDQQPPTATASFLTPTVTQKKPKRGTVQHVTLPNNNIANSQSRQVRAIMVYDILSTWSHSQILESLKEWGRVLKISFKSQHKYQSVWCKMVLSPLADTDFVMKTWWRKLGGIIVRWYPGSWRLKDRKVREQFQASITLSHKLSDKDILTAHYNEGKSIVDYHKAKLWKIYKTKSKDGKVKMTIILYFESQDALLLALEKKSKQGKKLIRTSTPSKKKKKVSEPTKVDKKKEG